MMKKLKSATILMSVFMSAALAACNSTSIPLSSSAETKLTMEAISDVDENESTYEETIESLVFSRRNIKNSLKNM